MSDWMDEAKKTLHDLVFDGVEPTTNAEDRLWDNCKQWLESAITEIESLRAQLEDATDLWRERDEKLQLLRIAWERWSMAGPYHNDTDELEKALSAFLSAEDDWQREMRANKNTIPPAADPKRERLIQGVCQSYENFRDNALKGIVMGPQYALNVAAENLFAYERSSGRG